MTMSEYERESHWQQFWHFNLGHLLIILGMLSTAVWWFLQYDREFTITKMTVARLAETVDRLSDRVERMDTTGTNFSQRGIGRDDEFQKATVERLKSVEGAIANLNLMKFQIDEIAGWVKEQKAEKKEYVR